MIFKQVTEIIEGKKTQTRRIVKKNEHLSDYNNTDGCTVFTTSKGGKRRIKWQVGRKYAVVPKRAQPQVYYRYEEDGSLTLAHTAKMEYFDETLLEWATRENKPKRVELIKSYGYKPLSIRLTAIRLERLHDITEADAIAEGIETVERMTSSGVEMELYKDYLYKDEDKYFKYSDPIKSYKSLWESINGKGSWDTNPMVWVLEFQVVT